MLDFKASLFLFKVWSVNLDKVSELLENYLLHSHLQYKVFIPLGIQCPLLVAGVEPGQRIGGQVEGAERIAATRHVFANEVASLNNLQVGLKVGFLQSKHKCV